MVGHAPLGDSDVSPVLPGVWDRPGAPVIEGHTEDCGGVYWLSRRRFGRWWIYACRDCGRDVRREKING